METPRYGVGGQWGKGSGRTNAQAQLDQDPHYYNRMKGEMLLTFSGADTAQEFKEQYEGIYLHKIFSGAHNRRVIEVRIEKWHSTLQEVGISGHSEDWTQRSGRYIMRCIKTS